MVAINFDYGNAKGLVKEGVMISVYVEVVLDRSFPISYFIVKSRSIVGFVKRI